ncbi:HEAT repeat domain-containing protein [Mariniblastus fucicola]|nr:hypothetical protein [Mariniblastus fucicola]
MIMQLFSRSLRFKILIAAALLIASPTTSIFAQDDATVIRDEATRDRQGIIRLGTDERVVRIENTEELLVRSVAQSNPTTAIELAKAIGLMIDIERFDVASEYLDSLASLELDGEASYELNRSVGPDLFYEIARAKDLQPLGRETAVKVFKAASSWANSDERVAVLIDQLASDDEYARGEAFAKLNRVGKKGVARVIETFADQNREDDFPAMRGALYAFGESAVGPLLGAAESNEPAVRIEAIRGLAKLESNQAVDMLLRQSLSLQTQSPFRELASFHLSKSGRAPARSDAESRLRSRVEGFLEGRRESAESLVGTVDVWSWNDDSGKLEVVEVESSVAARLRAAELARTLFEIDPTNTRNRELHLLSQLEFRKRRVGASQQINVDELLEQAENIDAVEIERLLVEAIDLDLIPAATAACEVLKQIGSDSQVVGAERRPLVNAILVGDRHLQFAAFDAIAEINPKTAYAGCSYVAELGAFLASSRFNRKCAVGHIRNEVAQAWATSTGPRGWSSMAATSSQEFFEKVTSDPDVAMLIVSDTLRRPEHRELVQQLRSHWKTRRMPIGLLARDANHLIRSVRYTEGIDRLLTFPISLDSGAIASQLDQLEDQQSPWNVSSDDRYRHAARAVQWLEGATTDPELDFYHFGAHQKQLLDLLYHPEFTSSAAKILATQPTAVAQRAMLGFVSQGDLPIEARELVADAFESAVKRGGTMLTTREIQLQYERYNASESQPAETQKVLGRVLDVIEARRKRSRR